MEFKEGNPSPPHPSASLPADSTGQYPHVMAPFVRTTHYSTTIANPASSNHTSSAGDGRHQSSFNAYQSHQDEFSIEHSRSHQPQHPFSTALAVNDEPVPQAIATTSQQPSASAAFFKALAYFGKWTFDCAPHELGRYAAEAYYFSSAGFTVWRFLSPTAKANLLSRWTEQLTTLRNDEDTPAALRRAIVHLADMHWVNSAEYLSTQRTTTQGLSRGEKAIEVLFGLLLHRAHHSRNAEQYIVRAQDASQSLFTDSSTSANEMAQALGLLRILGVAQPFQLSYEWDEFNEELEDQLIQDGLLVHDNDSGSQHATSFFGTPNITEAIGGDLPSSVPSHATSPPAVKSPQQELGLESRTEHEHSPGGASATSSFVPSTAATSSKKTPAKISQLNPPIAATSLNATPDGSSSTDQQAALAIASSNAGTSASVPSIQPSFIKGIGATHNLFAGRRAEAVNRYRYPSRTPFKCAMDNQAIDNVEQNETFWTDKLSDAVRAGPVHPSEDELEGVEALETFIEKMNDGTVEEITESLVYMIFDAVLDSHRNGHTLSTKEVKSVEGNSPIDVKNGDKQLTIEARLGAVIATLRQSKRVVMDCYNSESKIRQMVYGPNLVCRVKKAAWVSNKGRGKATATKASKKGKVNG